MEGMVLDDSLLFFSTFGSTKSEEAYQKCYSSDFNSSEKGS